MKNGVAFWRVGLRRQVKPLVYRLRSKLLYRLATFYVNAVDNDHDCDFNTNGELAFARRELQAAKTVFDIGAAKGTWTEIALAVNPELTVHCFEPASDRIAMIEAFEFGSRVKLNRVAVGEQSGTADIYIGAVGGSNSLFPQRYDGESYDRSAIETVTVVTVDDYCAREKIEHIDFLKMDIEGYEMSALRGSRRMLAEGRIQILQFEYSSAFLDAGTSLLQLMTFVREVNPAYEFHKILPDGTKLVSHYDHVLDNFKTQNWALIKRSM